MYINRQPSKIKHFSFKNYLNGLDGYSLKPYSDVEYTPIFTPILGNIDNGANNASLEWKKQLQILLNAAIKNNLAMGDPAGAFNPNNMGFIRNIASAEDKNERRKLGFEYWMKIFGPISNSILGKDTSWNYYKNANLSGYWPDVTFHRWYNDPYNTANQDNTIRFDSDRGNPINFNSEFPCEEINNINEKTACINARKANLSTGSGGYFIDPGLNNIPGIGMSPADYILFSYPDPKKDSLFDKFVIIGSQAFIAIAAGKIAFNLASQAIGNTAANSVAKQAAQSAVKTVGNNIMGTTINTVENVVKNVVSNTISKLTSLTPKITVDSILSKTGSVVAPMLIKKVLVPKVGESAASIITNKILGDKSSTDISDIIFDVTGNYMAKKQADKLAMDINNAANEQYQIPNSTNVDTNRKRYVNSVNQNSSTWITPIAIGGAALFILTTILENR